MNLSVSVIMLLFSVKSKLSSPYNMVDRERGAMCTLVEPMCPKTHVQNFS